MRHLPHSDSASYWRFYQHLGNLRAHSLRTLAHIVTIYGPFTSATDLQAALRKRALAELDRRAAQGNAEAQQVLRGYMGLDKPTKQATWEEQTGTDPNTGFTL
jgi:hypothetical protein